MKILDRPARKSHGSLDYQCALLGQAAIPNLSETTGQDVRGFMSFDTARPRQKLFFFCFFFLFLPPFSLFFFNSIKAKNPVQSI